MQKKQNTIGLVWFRNDLRVHDNYILHEASNNHNIIIAIYFFNPEHYKLDKFGFKKTEKYRTKTRRLEGLPAPMNEHNWYHPLPLYQNSYIKEAIESQFEATPIRVRLSRIAAGKFLTPHIDYCPSYAVRVIVPIQGTTNVVNKIWRRGEEESYEMPADGRAYFLNTGFKHSVEHGGSEGRNSATAQGGVYVLVEAVNKLGMKPSEMTGLYQFNNL